MTVNECNEHEWRQITSTLVECLKCGIVVEGVNITPMYNSAVWYQNHRFH